MFQGSTHTPQTGNTDRESVPQSAGGGLCGACATNHYDGQIYTPSYLFAPNGTRALRPVIASAPAHVRVGETLTATTTAPVTAWAMLRLGATTRRSPYPHQILRLPLIPSGRDRHGEHGPAARPAERGGERDDVHDGAAGGCGGVGAGVLLPVRDGGGRAERGEVRVCCWGLRGGWE